MIYTKNIGESIESFCAKLVNKNLSNIIHKEFQQT